MVIGAYPLGNPDRDFHGSGAMTACLKEGRKVETGHSGWCGRHHWLWGKQPASRPRA